MTKGKKSLRTRGRFRTGGMKTTRTPEVISWKKNGGKTPKAGVQVKEFDKGPLGGRKNRNQDYTITGGASYLGRCPQTLHEKRESSEGQLRKETR